MPRVEWVCGSVEPRLFLFFFFFLMMVISRVEEGNTLLCRTAEEQMTVFAAALFFGLSFIWAGARLWMCILMSRRRSSCEFNPALCLLRRALPRGALIVNKWCFQEHIVCILMNIWSQPNSTKSSENQTLTSCFSLRWKDWGSWELQKIYFSIELVKVL